MKTGQMSLKNIGLFLVVIACLLQAVVYGMELGEKLLIPASSSPTKGDVEISNVERSGSYRENSDPTNFDSSENGIFLSEANIIKPFQGISRMEVESVLSSTKVEEIHDAKYFAMKKELKKIIKNENFGQNLLQDNRTVHSIISKALDCLKKWPSEEAYRLFAEIVIPSPNIEIGQLLDEKDGAYFVKLDTKTAEWISPKSLQAKISLTLQTVQNMIKSREIHSQAEESEISKLREQVDYTMGIISDKSKILSDIPDSEASSSSNEMNHFPLERVLNSVFSSRISEPTSPGFHNVPDAATSLFEYDDSSMNSFTQRCLSDTTLPYGAALGLYRGKGFFLVKINSSRAEWVRPRSAAQRQNFVNDLIAMWNPIVYSSWISAEEFEKYLKRLTIILNHSSYQMGGLSSKALKIIINPTMRRILAEWSNYYKDFVHAHVSKSQASRQDLWITLTRKMQVSKDLYKLIRVSKNS